MSIVIKEVTDKKQLKAFIGFPYRLYKNHRFYVPPLRFDEKATLQKEVIPLLIIAKHDTGWPIKMIKLQAALPALLTKHILKNGTTNTCVLDG